MIKLILIFLISIISISCNSQVKTLNHGNKSTISKKMTKIDKIELTERTRGINRIIIYTSTSKMFSDNGQETKEKLLPAEWEKIIKVATLIDLSKISSFQAPTTGRFSDKALASTVIITSNGKTYESGSFDAGIPPKELEELYLLLKGKIQKFKPAVPERR
ncbi:hypothetical protein ATE47_13350 [Chryseobacterium sp. IHB B 17019]|uniref:hypothetical protein n=1 Tax=Chryseobacterium sp. IHB B 17019 TaxID=1721091 RepID=UPI0007214CE2|nr:hypothetical protein [Chryseobacterium sp. IHB B 17019]ALR31442.1 hypothetical protein ATE47_13350 [Chryseobacterium sp. IHB B 17019]